MTNWRLNKEVPGSPAHYLPLRQAQCRLFGDWRVEPGHELTDQGFTGQKHNMDLGLYYYNARFYLPYTNQLWHRLAAKPDSRSTRIYATLSP